MISAKEAAEAMTAMHRAMTSAGAFCPDEKMRADHAIALDRARMAQDQMNAVNQAYIEAAWAKTPPALPPEPKRVMAWELDRDDKAELRLWWDWKQLDPDVKREMLPPPCPSERTQAFMDTNPAWKFEEDGTIVGAKKEKSEIERAFGRETDRRHRLHVSMFCHALCFMVSFGIAMVAITVWVH